jgi:hypothetical protein
MNTGFEKQPDADDAATMVAELRGRLDDATLARALGVKRSELEMIAAGYPAKADAAKRLRMLHELGSTTDDLRDPEALLTGLGMTEDVSGRLPFALVPRLKTYLIAFLVIDTVVFLGFMVALFLTSR